MNMVWCGVAELDKKLLCCGNNGLLVLSCFQSDCGDHLEWWSMVWFVLNQKCLISIMELALRCAHELPEERLNMIEISTRLKKIRTILLPTNPTNRRRLQRPQH
ncbi:hypothetical protein Tsubulata_027270 [Turnera subulata]|uniref:Uncharacterized protein n=1 Tax=Turnera subulata TaxID=218843 RepID=A0A9Q0JHV1_9ROSI|nr:hypothetical protein Tsubulata_027270 [Turnera subulata]